VFVAILPVFNPKGRRFRDILLPVATAIMASFAEIALAGYLGGSR
jgi:hypothetical protein